MHLGDQQIERYGRQILLPEVGGRGQARLLAARVTVAGDGGAARRAVALLARAGVGALDVLGALPPPEALAPDCAVRSRADAARVPVGDVVVDLGDRPERTAELGRRAAGRPFVVGRQQGSRAALAVLVGRPCFACLPATALALPAGDETPLAVATADALGALAATETLAALLARPAEGRLHTLALADGVVRATPLATGGCPACQA